MKNLKLTKKESQVLDDVLNYMIDYMEDEVWTTQDRLAFDRIYSKLQFRRLMPRFTLSGGAALVHPGVPIPALQSFKTIQTRRKIEP